MPASPTRLALHPRLIAVLAAGVLLVVALLAAARGGGRAGDPAGRATVAVSATSAGVSGPESCDGEAMSIGSVQGAGSQTALTAEVTVRGVVVGDFEGPPPALRGFYLQDDGDGDRATSDGVFVAEVDGADRVAPGQRVQVSGVPGEFQGQTQLRATSVTTCGNAAPPRPVEVTLPAAAPSAGVEAWERYEGMLVRFPQRLSVTEHVQLGRFGQVVVSSGGRLWQPTQVHRPGSPEQRDLAAANALDRLIVDDAGQAQNPDPIVFARDGGPLSASRTLRAGDTLTSAVGVLTYTWSGNAASGNAFRLRPLGALGGEVRFVAANPRPTGPPKVGGEVKVASANLLNYFTTFGRGACRLGVRGGPTDCRGASDAAELARQAAKEVAELTTLDADVVAVMELQNDGYGPDSSLADLVGRLDAAQGPGSWAFVDVDTATGHVDAAGSDAIRVALLYRRDRVTPVAGATFADLTPPVPGLYDRVPVAQTFATRSGDRVTVVANHLKSKGSCPEPGAPDAPGNVDAGDGQGCWAARRVAQARELARWVREDVVPAAGDPDTLLVGDFNAYAQEAPLQVLADAGWTSLVPHLHGLHSYSYAFDGQWGSLDHAFASTSLLAQVTGADDLHVNADEPAALDYTTDFKSPAQQASLYAADRYRTSDHDPLLVGLDLGRRGGRR